MDAISLHFPTFLLGDDIFPLKKWLIKPYLGISLSEEQKIYHYCLSRARRIIENAFGILAARWGGYFIDQYELLALAPHNYLGLTSNAMYTPSGFVDSESGYRSTHLGE